MTQARDKANIPVLNFASKGIDDNATSTAITIDSNEDVGIGTTSAFARLVVQGANNENTMVVNTIGTSPNYILSVRDDGTAKFVVAGTGKVGIGEDVPIGLLHVKSADSGVSSVNGGANELFIENSSDAGITIASGATSFGKILFADSSNNADGQILYDQNGRSLRFGTAGTERLRIDSSGNVGIGTSSPSNTLDVNGVISSSSELRLNNAYTKVADADAQGGFAGGYNINVSTNEVQHSVNGSAYGIHYSSSALTFNTNGSASGGTAVPERMRIDSSGSVFFNTNGNAVSASQPGASFTRDTSGSNAGKVSLQLGTPVSGADTLATFFNTNGGVGSIVVSGSATAYNTSSDYRLKENVSYDFDATTRLKQLKPARFNFIADADTTVDGFIAHEVSTVVPEAISGTKDAMKTEEYELTPSVLDEDGNVITEAVMGTREVPDYQGIDQSKLVPLLVKTIQELEARITALETTTP